MFPQNINLMLVWNISGTIVWFFLNNRKGSLKGFPIGDRMDVLGYSNVCLHAIWRLIVYLPCLLKNLICAILWL